MAVGSPLRRNRLQPSGDDRFVVGRRRAGIAEVFIVDHDGVEALRPLGLLSDSVDWAGPREACAELAAAMLLAVRGEMASPDIRWLLADEVLVELPLDGFVLPESDVLAWIELLPAELAREWTPWHAK